MRPLTFVLTVIFFAAGCFAQAEKCGESTGYVFGRTKPSVFVEFEQFGKADDWGSYHLGEPMKKPDIKKGDDIWLRLYNNSCWDIKFLSTK